MSLKAFHVFFVTLSILFCGFVGVWGLGSYASTEKTMHLVVAVASLVSVPVLLVYGYWFLRKLRGVSFL